MSGQDWRITNKSLSSNANTDWAMQASRCLNQPSHKIQAQSTEKSTQQLSTTLYPLSPFFYASSNRFPSLIVNMKLSLVFTLAMVQSIAAEQVLNAFGQPSYGVDVSFPVHYGNVLSSDDPNQPLGERQALYDDFMKGCHDFYGKRGHSCDVTEQDRWDMSLRQPASMQVNALKCILYSKIPSHLLNPPSIAVLNRTTPIQGSRKCEHLNVSLNFSRPTGRTIKKRRKKSRGQLVTLTLTTGRLQPTW